MYYIHKYEYKNLQLIAKYRFEFFLCILKLIKIISHIQQYLIHPLDINLSIFLISLHPYNIVLNFYKE
jgi:hypothetical protein